MRARNCSRVAGKGIDRARTVSNILVSALASAGSGTSVSGSSPDLGAGPAPRTGGRLGPAAAAEAATASPNWWA